MSSGDSAGTLAIAASMIVAVRSSGRTSVIDPLKARPIGVRAVATITASGMVALPRTGLRGRVRSSRSSLDPADYPSCPVAPEAGTADRPSQDPPQPGSAMCDDADDGGTSCVTLIGPDRP